MSAGMTENGARPSLPALPRLSATRSHRRRSALALGTTLLPQSCHCRHPEGSTDGDIGYQHYEGADGR
jgi:hypothetical protein